MLAAVLATIGAVAVAPAHPVAAQQSCFADDAGKGANGSNWNCRWTQLDNNWPGSSTDPDCHAYCAFYISSQRYSYSDHVPMWAYGVDFQGDMATATQDWSGQPYNSPWFGNCNCPSGGAFLTLGQKDSGSGGRACGIGGVTTAWNQGVTNDNHIVAAEANFATDFTGSWFDGPPSATFSGQYCDAINTAYHEVGHAFGEGHSSIPADIMNWSGGQDTRTIDADAQELLRTLYGAHTPSTPNIPIHCGPCRFSTTAPASQVCSPPAPSSVAECIAYNYLAKAWDLAHAGPTVDPVPIVGATPLASGCLGVAVDYQTWVTCVLGWEGWK